jgi:SNF2 family DNA or RNA helicase
LAGYALLSLVFALFHFLQLLCDDMGLGKTLTTLSLIASCGEKGQTLVVCPASLFDGWREQGGIVFSVLFLNFFEASEHCPSMKLLVYHVNNRDRYRFFV